MNIFFFLFLIIYVHFVSVVAIIVVVCNKIGPIDGIFIIILPDNIRNKTKQHSRREMNNKQYVVTTTTETKTKTTSGIIQ